ncbi:four helix bundle protein [bacterium]|nr:four helix bundle protein [bacterium]
MRVKKIEDLNVWQLAREMVVNIYRITKNKGFKNDFGLSNQIQRASVSVLSNIAEGSEYGSDAEFRRYLQIAKDSIGEVRAQLYVAVDLFYIEQDEFELAHSKAENISKMISSLIKYLKGEN